MGKPVPKRGKPSRRRLPRFLDRPTGEVATVEQRRTPEVIPAALAGRYIAWTPDALRIIGHGATIAEAREGAGNLPGLIIQKVPATGRIRPVRPAAEETKAGPVEG